MVWSRDEMEKLLAALHALPERFSDSVRGAMGEGAQPAGVGGPPGTAPPQRTWQEASATPPGAGHQQRPPRARRYQTPAPEDQWRALKTARPERSSVSPPQEQWRALKAARPERSSVSPPQEQWRALKAAARPAAPAQATSPPPAVPALPERPTPPTPEDQWRALKAAMPERSSVSPPQEQWRAMKAAAAARAAAPAQATSPPPAVPARPVAAPPPGEAEWRALTEATTPGIPPTIRAAAARLTPAAIALIGRDMGGRLPELPASPAGQDWREAPEVGMPPLERATFLRLPQQTVIRAANATFLPDPFNEATARGVAALTGLQQSMLTCLTEIRDAVRGGVMSGATPSLAPPQVPSFDVPPFALGPNNPMQPMSSPSVDATTRTEASPSVETQGFESPLTSYDVGYALQQATNDAVSSTRPVFRAESQSEYRQRMIVADRAAVQSARAAEQQPER